MAYSYDNLKLDKGMYSEAAKSFSAVLEKADPTENYRGTPLEGLDAFQRQLKRFDIKVKGMGSDAVEKFFSTADSAVLFPEYVARCVRQGMEENNILPEICASVTKFDGMDYRAITSVPADDDKVLKGVLEGTAIPQTYVKTQENLVKLHKRGRMLVASYEAIRFQKLDLFSVMLRQIGSHIMRMHLEDAVGVIINGDGNENAAKSCSVGTSPIGGTSGSLGYAELIDFWGEFAPYEMNTILAAPDAMLEILKISAFQDPLAGGDFHGTGRMVTPMGATLLRSDAVASGKLIGLDKNYALEMIRSSDVIIEYDKLIDKQLERAAITSISGFAKIFKDASLVLNI